MKTVGMLYLYLIDKAEEDINRISSTMVHSAILIVN